MLITHYRQPLELDRRSAHRRSARRTLDHWYERERRGRCTPTARRCAPIVLERSTDDLNTPQAIAALHALALAKHAKGAKRCGGLA